MIGLPSPRLTATISAPVRKGDLGRVVVLGYVPPVPAPDPADATGRRRGGGRSNKPHRCSMCGGPHNKRNRRCPAMGK